MNSVLPEWVYQASPAAMALLVLVALLVFRKVPLRYNMRNVLVRWRVTVLTASAFALIVALLTVMLAFVNGMYRLTEGSGQSGNVIVLSDGATDELFSNLSYSDTSNIEQEPGVERDEEGRALCSREVYIIVNQPVPNAPPGRPKRRFVQVRGVDDPRLAARVHGLSLIEGQWFSEAGVEELPSADGRVGQQVIQAILGEAVAVELAKGLYDKPRLEVGDLFELGPRTWKVVGILGPGSSTFGSEIWGKFQVVGPLFGKERYTSIVLRTADLDSARRLAEHLTKNFKQAAVQAQPEWDYYKKLNATNEQFLVSIMFVAAVMAVGGVFSIMNTMFAAISQRIKDIGVLRVLGYSRWQILASFFLESLLLALAGGLVGCAVGSLADGWTASSIVSSGQGGGKTVILRLVVDVRTLAVGLTFSLVMGAVGGILPAVSAMRIRILDALR